MSPVHADGAPVRFRASGALEQARVDYAAPHGLFLLARPDEAPTACGALSWLDDHRAEVKRMWVACEGRGRGLGRPLLTALEGKALAAGRSRVVLDTNSALVEAVGHYSRMGVTSPSRRTTTPARRPVVRPDAAPPLTLPLVRDDLVSNQR